MDTYINENSYEYFNTHFGKPTEKKCIDGRITGSNKCCGFCNYAGHPGFLTQRNIADHQCLKKECMYFIERTRKKRVFRNAVGRTIREIEFLALSEITKFEGMKIIQAKWNTTEVVLQYVSIVDYNLSAIEDKIESISNVSVRFQQIPCDYLIAVGIIFGKSVAISSGSY